MTNDSAVWDPLQRWSPALFLAGGTVLIGFAVSLAIIGMMDGSAPRNVFAGIGFALAFLGLLGLYPQTAEQSPRLARAGAVFAALGAVGFTLTFVLVLVEFVGIDPPAWVAAVQLLNIVGLVPGFFVFGVVSLRTDARSRRLGLLLLVPAIVFTVNIVRVAVLGSWTPAWAPFLLGSLQALAMLAIGYSLRTQPGPRERADPPADTAA